MSDDRRSSSTPATCSGGGAKASAAGPNLEGDAEFEQLGFQLVVVDPGEPVCMYHGERAQEDFLVVSGECVLVIEGEERR